ncbi:unnamed protein product, partial [Ectocarpus sp. 8 AP-2014]
GRVVWRTDLRATERHWRDWFEGMSKAFLELPAPKLLIVAGMDRLDTELTAAHMQGRWAPKKLIQTDEVKKCIGVGCCGGEKREIVGRQNKRAALRPRARMHETQRALFDRYQLKLVYGSGHSIQEDQPEETAKSIINFALR